MVWAGISNVAHTELVFVIRGTLNAQRIRRSEVKSCDLQHLRTQKSAVKSPSTSYIVHVESFIIFRFVTFGLNAFVLRYVSQSVVGVMNVRLLLLESTILFLSREAFRRACLSKTTDHNWAQVINLLWLTLPLCQIFSFIFGYIWLHILTPPSTKITEHYELGVWSVCFSCVIEMCCEPVYLVSQAFLFVRFKVIVQVVSILVRTATFTPIIVYSPRLAVVAFSIAQVLAAVVYTIGHYVYFHYYMKHLMKKRALMKKDDDNGRVPLNLRFFPFESLMDFLPSKMDSQDSIIDSDLAILTWSFFKQGILKQFLTEGERYIMTLFSVLSFSEQGVYDVVNNLGSIAARFLFRPVEDSAYFYFSQMVTRDIPIKEQNQKHMAESAKVLYEVIRCITCIGLVIVVFGQSYSHLLLFLYGGESLILGPGPTLMLAHCLAVLLIAINGITECYAFATMNTPQLDRYNRIMAVLSVLFLVVAWLLTRLFGGVGFILANCYNMGARIALGVVSIKYRYKDTEYKPLNGLIPGPLFLVMLACVTIVTQISQAVFSQEFKILHLGVGVFCFLSILITWGHEERELVNLAIQKWTQSSQTLKQE
ncbi:man(5)GlcNAc(2)-PP-dolichol translocation protein RFT1-like [Periplaneta americana]|uniref:man(5)GlcNAc(2)-PP-dolichol translocation protein RFT1-like n=1 Tax=Periplaneta americana TaxID=6978 RepID=UPI0037E71D8F